MLASLFKILSLSLFLGAVSLPAPAGAQPTGAISINSNERVNVTGTVSNVNRDFFILDTGQTTFSVTLRRMNVTSSVSDLVRPGMKVNVRGALSRSVLRGTQIEAESLNVIDTVPPPVSPPAPVTPPVPDVGQVPPATEGSVAPSQAPQAPQVPPGQIAPAAPPTAPAPAPVMPEGGH